MTASELLGKCMREAGMPESEIEYRLRHGSKRMPEESEMEVPPEYEAWATEKAQECVRELMEQRKDGITFSECARRGFAEAGIDPQTVEGMIQSGNLLTGMGHVVIPKELVAQAISDAKSKAEEYKSLLDHIPDN